MAVKYGLAMRTNWLRQLRYNKCCNDKLDPNFRRTRNYIVIQYFYSDSGQHNWFDHDFTYQKQNLATFSP